MMGVGTRLFLRYALWGSSIIGVCVGAVFLLKLDYRTSVGLHRAPIVSQALSYGFFERWAENTHAFETFHRTGIAILVPSLYRMLQPPFMNRAAKALVLLASFSCVVLGFMVADSAWDAGFLASGYIGDVFSSAAGHRDFGISLLAVGIHRLLSFATWDFGGRV